MNRRIGLGLVRALALPVALGGLVAACGGGATPAPNNPDPSLADPKQASADSKPAAAPSATAGAADGPVAKPSSDDVARGVAALKAGSYNDARAAFEAAIKANGKQADAHYYLGLVMDKTGDRAAAEKEYREALSLSPDLQEAAENLTAIYVEAQKFDDAIAIAKKALAKNAKNAEMQLNFAIALGGKGDEAASTKAFDDAIKLAPNDARFYVAYAQQLAAWKKRDAAVAKLKEAQRVAGEDAAMLGTVGFELRTQRAVPECIAAFDKAIALKDNADFRTNRALCKTAAKDKAGALADLKEAVTKEPGFAPAHYWYGLALHEDGKFPEAAAEYEAYLKVAPKGPMAKAAAAKLKLAQEKKKAAPKAAP